MERISLPLIAVTLGDPAGVGPETIVGAWSQPIVHESCLPFVVGHPQIVRRAIELIESQTRVVEIDSPEQAEPAIDTIPCLRAGSDEALEVMPGAVDARGGQAAYDALLVAARAALAGRIDGLTTAPLHKAALWKAGHEYPGHTELLAELCDVDEFAMMLYLGPCHSVTGTAGLSIVHVTLHMALADAVASLNEEAVVSKTRLVASVASELKGSPARIGVCALNPHAGEDGLFGGEEQTIIRPAVERARAEGIDAIGPLPADTLIARAAAGEFDAVVAMYHDQGHIAIKLLAMHRAVNVTLGLPIVRTSVAHGTAFDLAWQGRAETSGMVEALRVAARLSRARGRRPATRQR
jgi:4-hydroxythreonine-4-phosphate dehydrogenase